MGNKILSNRQDRLRYKNKIKSSSIITKIHSSQKRTQLQFFCTFFLHLFKQILPLTLSAFYPLTQLFMHLDIIFPSPSSFVSFFLLFLLLCKMCLFSFFLFNTIP